jgi:predicted metal-dependent hydrolase
MPTIHDAEFGKVVVRRSVRARHVKLKVHPDGNIRASLPLYAPMLLVKRLIHQSRDKLRGIVAEQSIGKQHYTTGMTLGKSHRLVVVQTHNTASSIKRQDQSIVIYIAENETLETPQVRKLIQAEHIKLLRTEAKAYLPRQLRYLAETFGFDYEKVRFSHSSGRWGSCSSQGTISLNIALMKLDHSLINYVLIHELCHTKHMNHSPAFWALVQTCDPQYKSHRLALKHEHPYV